MCLCACVLILNSLLIACPIILYTQSYAGKYVPAIGYKIHTENMNNPAVKINLKGLAIGDGWSDPENVRKRVSVQALCVRVVLVKSVNEPHIQLGCVVTFPPGQSRWGGGN